MSDNSLSEHVLAKALDRVIAEQQAFEDHRATRLGRGAAKLTAPIGAAAARFVPPSMVRAALGGADQLAGLTLAKGAAHDADDISACDAAALHAQSWAMGLNAASGVSTGWLGLLGLAIDLPSTLSIAARNVRATGLAYGFGGNGPDEKAFRLAILELAATGGLSERANALGRLNKLAAALEGAASTPVGREGVDWLTEQMVERVARQLGVSLSQRKLAQVIPVAGAAVAAAVNASFQTDVSRAARYAYRQRWLMGRKMLPAPTDAAEVG